jgi:hypothetical protein
MVKIDMQRYKFTWGTKETWFEIKCLHIYIEWICLSTCVFQIVILIVNPKFNNYMYIKSTWKCVFNQNYSSSPMWW